MVVDTPQTATVDPVRATPTLDSDGIPTEFVEPPVLTTHKTHHILRPGRRNLLSVGTLILGLAVCANYYLINTTRRARISTSDVV